MPKFVDELVPGCFIIMLAFDCRVLRPVGPFLLISETLRWSGYEGPYGLKVPWFTADEEELKELTKFEARFGFMVLECPVDPP